MGSDTINGDYQSDSIDFILLNRLQENFPLVSEPWLEIASDAGITPDELFIRLSKLQNCGIIRGITPVLKSGKFGLNAGTLIAVHLEPEMEDEAADIINSYPEVSHNYIRDHYYSMWFTIKAESPERINEILAEIKKKIKISDKDILNLQTVCSYKTDVRFCCSEISESGQKQSDYETMTMDKKAFGGGADSG